MADISESCFKTSAVSTTLLGLDAIIALTGACIGGLSSYYICKPTQNNTAKTASGDTTNMPRKYQILSIICNVGFGISGILNALLILAFDLCIETLVHSLGQSWAVFIVSGQLSMFAIFIHRLKDVFLNTGFQISSKLIKCFICLLFLQIFLILATLPMFIFVNLFYGFILFSCFLFTYFISSFLLVSCFLKNLNDFVQFIATFNANMRMNSDNITINYGDSSHPDLKYNDKFNRGSEMAEIASSPSSNMANYKEAGLSRSQTSPISQPPKTPPQTSWPQTPQTPQTPETPQTPVTPQVATSPSNRVSVSEQVSTQVSTQISAQVSPQVSRLQSAESSSAVAMTMDLNTTNGSSNNTINSDSEHIDDCRYNTNINYNYNVSSRSNSPKRGVSIRNLKKRVEKRNECDEIKSLLIRYTLLVTIALTSTVISTIFMALASIVNWEYFIIIVQMVFTIDALINVICLNLQFGFNLYYYKVLCKNCHECLTICCSHVQHTKNNGVQHKLTFVNQNYN